MKKLFIIRHAKSSWSDTTLDDINRPLNKRGLKDAPFMAKLLYDKNVIPDLIISSPSLRTKLTLKFFMDELNYDKEIIYKEEIYEAPMENIFEVVKNIDYSFETVFLFGHNPGLNEFVNFICDANIENIPTCGIVELEFDIDSWENISIKNSKLNSFEYPKKYKN